MSNTATASDTAERAAPLASQLANLAPQMDVVLDPAQCALLEQYARLLLRWNRVHNLTSITGDDQVLTHHLLDSLSIVPAVRELAAGGALRVLDVGAGAGLPGIPLAVALPPLRVTLLDAVSKKCAFMTQAKMELALANVEVVHRRAEQLHAMRFDLIVSRALATLADFTAITSHLLAPGGRWLAMKGAEPLPEISALGAGVQVLKTVKLRVPRLDEERHLVVLTAAG